MSKQFSVPRQTAVVWRLQHFDGLQPSRSHQQYLGTPCVYSGGGTHGMRGGILQIGKAHGPGSGEQREHLVLVLPDNLKSSNSAS